MNVLEIAIKQFRWWWRERMQVYGETPNETDSQFTHRHKHYSSCSVRSNGTAPRITRSKLHQRENKLKVIARTRNLCGSVALVSCATDEYLHGENSRSTQHHEQTFSKFVSGTENSITELDATVQREYGMCFAVNEQTDGALPAFLWKQYGSSSILERGREREGANSTDTIFQL